MVLPMVTSVVTVMGPAMAIKVMMMMRVTEILKVVEGTVRVAIIPIIVIIRVIVIPIGGIPNTT